MYDSNKVEAREQTDFKYFLQMLPEDWTATRTEGQYCSYDVTTTNGEKIIYVELKARDIYLTEKIKSEGAFIDCKKVDALYELGNSCIIQFFWKSNVTYVWDVKDRDKWEKDQKLMRKNNFTEEKELKCVYILPFEEKNARYTVDLTNYWTDFTTTWDELAINNNQKQE